MPSAIRFEDVTVRLGRRLVLDRLTFAVSEGERVLLSGPSGSGKSTVLRTLLGFVAPTSGHVEIGGERLSPETVWRLRRRMAYVPQDPELGLDSVRDWLLTIFAYRANVLVAPDEQRIAERLEDFFLPASLLDQRAAALSGGERQRVALAAALLLDRPILLLDEPTSSLDQANREAVYRVLHAQQDRTMLLISHDEPAGRALADRVVRIDEAV